MRGTVVTFYSYKGGVGRSFALVNTATILASWGYRVLCVDWDLEAPGLDAYFRPHLAGPPESGLADVFTAFGEGRPAEPGSHVLRLDMDVRGRIDFLPAGGGEGYVRKAQRLDWASLYRDHDLGAELEKWRQRWADDYHFVLIDSRTGITDIGGICTAQMPDILVTMFTANEQSLRGVQEVVRRADRARDKLPYDRGGLMVLPVPSRFEGRDEYDQASRWRRRFASELTPLFDRCISRETTADVVLGHVTIPYVAFWSFGEEIAALREQTPSPTDICYPLQTIAALLAHRLDRTSLLAEGRDSFVGAAARGGLWEDEDSPREQVFLSFDAQHDEAARYAQACRVELERRQLDVFLAPIHPGVRMRGGSATNEALTRSTSMIAVVSDRPLPEQQRDIETFLRQSLDGESDRAVIPVLLPGVSAAELPPAARSIQALRPASSDPVESTATQVALQIEYRAALAAYHRTVADGSPGDRAPELLGRLLRVAEQARDFSDKAIAKNALNAAAVLADLMTRHPADRWDLAEEASLRLRLAMLLAERKRYFEALDHAKAGLDARRRLADHRLDHPLRLIELAASLRLLAQLDEELDEVDAARASLTEALEVLSQAAELFPDSIAVLVERCRVLAARSRVDWSRGDFNSAFDALEERRRLTHSISARDRSGTGHVREIAQANLDLAELLVNAGQPDRTDDYLLESLAAYRQLLTADGRDVEALRGLATTSRLLGDTLADRDAAAAQRHYEEAVEALSLLAALDSTEQRRYDLASALTRMGSLTTSPAEAAAFFERALTALGRPGSGSETDKAAARLRADLLLRLGMAEMERGDAATGSTYFDQALTVSRRLLSVDPTDPEAHEIAFRVNSQLGSFAFQEGNLGEARRLIRSALESAKRVPYADSARRRMAEFLAEIDQASAK
ncbi:MAG: hypothetical protein ABW022_14985 [Actinoplanes sp.]